MPKKEFTSKLERFEGSGTWTYADIPFDVEKAFGKKGQVKVKGTVNGVGFLSSLMPHGDGTHFLVVNRPTRDAAKIKEGAKVRIVLEADSEPRVIQAPPDLERALAKNKSAAASWEKLAPSHKKGIRALDHGGEKRRNSAAPDRKGRRQNRRGRCSQVNPRPGPKLTKSR